MSGRGVCVSAGRRPGALWERPMELQFWRPPAGEGGAGGRAVPMVVRDDPGTVFPLEEMSPRRPGRRDHSRVKWRMAWRKRGHPDAPGLEGCEREGAAGPVGLLPPGPLPIQWSYRVIRGSPGEGPGGTCRGSSPTNPYGPGPARNTRGDARLNGGTLIFNGALTMQTCSLPAKPLHPFGDGPWGTVDSTFRVSLWPGGGRGRLPLLHRWW